MDWCYMGNSLITLRTIALVLPHVFLTALSIWDQFFFNPFTVLNSVLKKCGALGYAHLNNDVFA